MKLQSPRDAALLFGSEFLMARKARPSVRVVAEARDRVEMSPCSHVAVWCSRNFFFFKEWHLCLPF